MDAFLNFYKDRDEMTFNELDDEMHNAMSNYIQKMANSIYNYAQSNNIPNVLVDYLYIQQELPYTKQIMIIVIGSNKAFKFKLVSKFLRL